MNTKSDVNTGLTLLSGIGVGAGLMYVLDPVMGNRRRALVRDQTVRIMNDAGDAVGPTTRDLSNRARGLGAKTISLFQSEDITDEVLVARVRSELGRVVSHPSAIEVTAMQGRVTLSGPILASEEKALLSHVSAVRGVTEVENRLEVHEQADNVPGLQGGSGRREPRFELMQTNWAPTTRLLTSAVGGALAYYSARRRSLSAIALGSVGLGLLARGLTNVELRRLVGVDGGHRAVDIQKTITIAAPVEQVFDLWSNYQYFPYFMSNVQGVRDLGNRRSHWIVAGPARVPVEWDAVITELIPNQVLAWRSEPGAAVQHAGIIRFESAIEGSTRVHIRLSYNPPAGAAGHAVATLFGADPKRQMDADLVRMKTFIETGTVPHDAAQPAH